MVLVLLAVVQLGQEEDSEESRGENVDLRRDLPAPGARGVGGRGQPGVEQRDVQALESVQLLDKGCTEAKVLRSACRTVISPRDSRSCARFPSSQPRPCGWIAPPE